MAIQNAPILSFNRGLIDDLSLGRTDLERTRLSASIYRNWLPKTQGAMIIRPGTKYLGSSLNDTGAYFIEFVAATDDVALLELTGGKMRVWANDVLTWRPKVDTTLAISDTGWSNASKPASDTGRVEQNDTGMILNAHARGGLARARKRVVVSDTGTEHSLAIQVKRGPITMRVGNDTGDEDLIRETTLRTGYHNLAFTPTQTAFHITVQTDSEVDRIIKSMAIADSGTVEVTTPWTASQLDCVRWDQSADVVFADCLGAKPYRIERRGTGNSWSVVENNSDNGPFLAGQTSSARLQAGAMRGNTTLTADIPFFDTGHAGALFRLVHDGQDGVYNLGDAEAITATWEVTGISDTGTTPDTDSERRFQVSVSGTYVGTMVLERSFDAEDFGFKAANSAFDANDAAMEDTGTISWDMIDLDDNLNVWYRVRMKGHTSGTAVVTVTYGGGSVEGICRVIQVTSNTQADVEVVSQFSDTGSTDVWNEGAWSGRRGYPQAVAFHQGRIMHAGEANIWGSVSDDFNNFDDTVEGDAGPISRTLGSGPVDRVFYLLSLQALMAGTAGQEIAIRSSNLDEPVTPDNVAARAFSTLGSMNVRALKHDTEMIMVHRSEQRVYLVAIGIEAYDYEPTELSVLVPTLLRPGVVSCALQRQPDSRCHFVLGDGTVAILTYEQKEEVLCWSLWSSPNAAVEQVMIVPGIEEDQVYYHVRRTINGQTRRFLEKWAKESETAGDTGLNYLADCAVAWQDTGLGGDTGVQGFGHLVGEKLIAWANDTGQGNNFGMDLSYDTGNPQDTGDTRVYYTVDTGGGLSTLPRPVSKVVAGIEYTADWKSTQMAYGAELGTALGQYKNINGMAIIAKTLHNNALFAGGDTGYLDPMPRMIKGKLVDRDHIFPLFTQFQIPFNGGWSEDERVYLRGKGGRPATILALVPTVSTNERA